MDKDDFKWVLSELSKAELELDKANEKIERYEKVLKEIAEEIHGGLDYDHLRYFQSIAQKVLDKS